MGAEPMMRGSALADRGGMSRWRFGIRAKLVVAVGTVAGMILVAGILTWFSYSEIERLLAAVTHTNLPSVSNALKLSEATARLAAAVPALDGSQSQFQRQSNFVALQQQTERLLALIDQLADTATDTGRVEELRSMIAAFGDNVVDRNILVDKRLQLADRGRSLAEVITGLDLEIHRSTEGLAADQTLAVVVLASNYLREAVVAPDLEKVGDLRSAYEEQVRRLPMLIDAAGGGPRAVRARELTRRVLALGTGPENVFELRSLQMLTIARLAAANDEGRDLVARTSSAVGRLVSAAEADAADNERRTEAAVSIGRYTLLVVAMMTFFGPLLFVWLYLGRNLVSRLTGLAESMHRIVEGDFQAPIVGSGNDEIADMAAELVVFRDAMAKVQESSRALMASEERLRRIIDTSPLALAISRVSDSVIISVNPRWSELYLTPEPDAIGAKVSSCYADPQNRVRLVELVRQRGFVPGFECRMRASDGHEFWAMLSAAQIEMDGEPAVIVSSTDITRHKEEEAALAEAKRMAEDASQAKSLFLATMSHEIRTPMNGVLTMAHLLEDMPLPAEQREMARVIRDSATSLLTIINDILDFSKIEAGKLELEVVDMSVVEVVEGVAELLTLRAQEKGIGLITYVDPTLPDRMRGDPVRLRQIITNLAGNAIKFTDKGYVRISVKAADAGERPLRLQVAVTDTGIGLDSEQQARLFEPFMQADITISRRYGGTGLGLSICRRLVAIMNGEIGVASNVGVGSTFWFTVPLAVTVEEPEAGPDLSGIAVLVLAEGPVAAECIRQYLGHFGAQVAVVASADGALAAARAAALAGWTYDVALMDASKDYRARLGVAGALTSAAGVKAEMRVVLIASHDVYPAASAEIKAGALFAVLPKPVRRRSLWRTVAAAAGRGTIEVEEQGGRGLGAALRRRGRRRRRPDPGRRGQSHQQGGHPPSDGAAGLCHRGGRRRGRGVGEHADQGLRPAADRLPYAGNGRLRADPAGAGRGDGDRNRPSYAHRRPDRRRAVGNGAALPRMRHGRLPGQAHRSGATGCHHPPAAAGGGSPASPAGAGRRAVAAGGNGPVVAACSSTRAMRAGRAGRADAAGSRSRPHASDFRRDRGRGSRTVAAVRRYHRAPGRGLCRRPGGWRCRGGARGGPFRQGRRQQRRRLPLRPALRRGGTGLRQGRPGDGGDAAGTGAPRLCRGQRGGGGGMSLGFVPQAPGAHSVRLAFAAQAAPALGSNSSPAARRLGKDESRAR